MMYVVYTGKIELDIEVYKYSFYFWLKNLIEYNWTDCMITSHHYMLGSMNITHIHI